MGENDSDRTTKPHPEEPDSAAENRDGAAETDRGTASRASVSEPAIRLRGLTKRYGSGADAVLAVDELDLTVERGEIFGFLGRNGAGKSTTIDMVLDYARPTSGSATVLGMDARTETERIRERIGVLPEGFGLYDRLTGRRHLEFAIDWADASDDPATILDRVGLDERDADRPVGEYSKGMHQRLALGLALVGQPDLLVLDEPSAGLDPHGIRRMREIVRAEAERGATVFFSSHVLGQVEAVCDRVGILHDGALVAVDTVDGLRKAVGSGTELRLRVTGEVDADLAHVAGVESVTHEDGILRVACADSTAKARVVTRLHTAGVEVLDVDSASASLEDVFRAYTTPARDPEATEDDRDRTVDDRCRQTEVPR